MSILVAVVFGVVAWFNTQIGTTNHAVAQVGTELKTEQQERLKAQSKTDVAVEQIRVRVEQIQKDIERVERGQEATQKKIDRVLEELQRGGRGR